MLSFENLESLRRTFQNYVTEYAKTMTGAPCSRVEAFLKMQGRWYEEIDKLISLAYYIVAKIKVTNLDNIGKETCFGLIKLFFRQSTPTY